MQKFVAISQTIAEMWRVFYFSKQWPSIILDLLRARLDKLHKQYLVLSITAKFGYNWYSNFDNMQKLVLILDQFGFTQKAHPWGNTSYSYDI